MKFSKLMSAMLFTAAAVMLSACNDDDEPTYQYFDPTTGFANALVTTKTADDGTFFLQITDDKTMLPCNISKSPYDREMRALINYTEIKAEDYPSFLPDGDLKGCDMLVKVNWIDSILTKMPVPDLLDKNDEAYGNDAVEIVKDWVTIAEDGYLTLRFRTMWGGHTMHRINLIAGVNAENPYEVELRHDAQGDMATAWGDALVAFDLNSLPDTEGATVKLKLRWRSFSGEKSAEFDFTSRKATGGELPTEGLTKSRLLK